MSSARLIRILRSASFRLPLLYAVLFILSAGVLFASVYWTATAAMQNDMAAVLREIDDARDEEAARQLRMATPAA
jgi:hypothetical protein